MCPVSDLLKILKEFSLHGFSEWGMTTSFVSAKLLTDLIMGSENEWKDFYNPSRIVGKGPKISKIETEVENLRENEGKIIIKNNQKIAVYKDVRGNINAMSAVCTHMGCIVDWNNKEKTWDCPCHGSRFNRLGEVIHGPAKNRLPREEV